MVCAPKGPLYLKQGDRSRSVLQKALWCLGADLGCPARLVITNSPVGWEVRKDLDIIHPGAGLPPRTMVLPVLSSQPSSQ